MLSQVFRKCTADVDPVVAATLFKGGADPVCSMLQEEFGLEVLRHGKMNAFTITGSMLQLTCAQNKLDVLYRDHQWLQQRQLIENMQKQFEYQSASAMLHSADAGMSANIEMVHESTSAKELDDVITSMQNDDQGSISHENLDGSYTFWEDGQGKEGDVHPLNTSLQYEVHNTTAGLNFSLPAMHLGDQVSSNARVDDETFSEHESITCDLSTTWQHDTARSEDYFGQPPELERTGGSSLSCLDHYDSMLSPQRSVMSEVLQKQLFMSLSLGNTTDLEEDRDLRRFKSLDAIEQTRALDHQLNRDAKQVYFNQISNLTFWCD